MDHANIRNGADHTELAPPRREASRCSPRPCALAVFVLQCCRALDDHFLESDRPVQDPLRGVLIFISLLEVFVLLLAHVAMIRELSTIQQVRPWTIWNMYVSVFICYTTIFFTLFGLSRASFNRQTTHMQALDTRVVPRASSAFPTDMCASLVLADWCSVQGYEPDVKYNPGSDVTDESGSIIDDSGGPGELSDLATYTDPIAVYLFLLYFSSAILTSTGFGDIAPTRMHTMMLVNMEMLVGMLYHAGVFGFALDHFMRLQKRRRREEQAEKKRLFAEAELARARDRTLLIAIRDDSIVREPHDAASSPITPGMAASPITPGMDIPHRVLLSSPHSSSDRSDSVASSSPPSSAPHTPETSSPVVPHRVLLSNPSSPTRASPEDDTDHDQEDELVGLGLGVLEPMDMTIDERYTPLYAQREAPPSQTTQPVSSTALSNALPKPLRVKPSRTFFSQFTFWRTLKSKPWFERLRKGVITNLLLLELILQMLSASLMFTLNEPFKGLAEKEGADYRATIVVLVIASLLLLAQLALNAGISLRLMNKISRGSFTDVLDERGDVVARIPKEGVTASFLTQCYMSAILVFASIYFFLFAFTPTHEFSRAAEFSLDVVEVWFTFIYFSCVVMTGTGFGDMYARGLLSRLSGFHRQEDDELGPRTDFSSSLFASHLSLSLSLSLCAVPPPFRCWSLLSTRASSLVSACSSCANR
jgi:hypothetical protein